MLFGLRNAPSTFQTIMNRVLRPFLRKFVLVFMDDILVYSRTLLDHVEHLSAMLSVLREHQLVANKKMFFCFEANRVFRPHCFRGKSIS